MKRVVLGSLIAAVVLTAGQQGFSQPGKSNPAKFGWQTSLEKGKQLARASGKPLLVVFRCDP